MGLITVNYSLNQTYLVEKQVFEKIVKLACAKSKLSKTNSFNVDISEEKNDFKIEMNISVKSGASLKDAITELEGYIEEYSLNIIESKPENITMIIGGEY